MTSLSAASSSYVSPGSKLILVYCEPRERATTTDSYDYLYPQLVKIPHRAIKAVDSEYLKKKSWEHKTFLLVLPGGIFSKCEHFLQADGILKIINFVKNYQGRIFGICSWAYGLSQKSSYETSRDFIERDRSGSPLYLCPTFAKGPIREETPSPLLLGDSWESTSFDGCSSYTSSGSDLVRIYSPTKPSRPLSSSFARLGSTDSLDGFFSRFSPSPPPTFTFSSDIARPIQIWRPDGTSGCCHYLNGAKLTPLSTEGSIVNFASFDKESTELAILGYVPEAGGFPGNVVLSSVHPEYTGQLLSHEETLFCKPLQILYEELSSIAAKKFNQDLWDAIISYFDSGDDPA